MRSGRLLAFLSCLLLAACAAGAGPSAKRPPVQAADTVDSVDRSLIAGSWQCHELNPLPDVPRVQTTYEFKPDGALASSGRSEQMEQDGTPVGLGPMLVTGTGTWQVDGQDLVIKGTRTEASAANGDPLTSAIASIASSIANTTGIASTTARANVLRLGPHEMVMRGVGVEDPPVISCSR
jgi:hypothetical protein